MKKYESKLMELIRQYADAAVTKITPEMRFREDLGFSSLAFMSFLGDVEDVFDVEADEEKALKLHEKYDDFEETQMLLPLSVLYYKLRCMDRAKEYLDRVVKANPDTKRFFRALRQDRLEELEAEISDFGYRPFTFEELVVEYRENEFLFRTVEAYGRWADRQLIVKKKQ